MLKDLVVPMTGTAGDTDALKYATDLASVYDSHLTVLEMVHLPIPSASPWGFVPDQALGEVYQKIRADSAARAAALIERLKQEPVLSEVRLVEAPYLGPLRMVAQCAKYADLTVVAGALDNKDDAETARGYFGSLLFESGRPVLVVPPGCKATLPAKRILLAWRPTLESVRALHDALPLLQKAEAVDLVIVDPVEGENAEGDQPGAAVGKHLARHGVKVNVVVIKSDGRVVSALLLKHAREMQADLVVAGGYGHSRLREWAMGGVTRELLAYATLPVFYSR